MIHFGLFEVDLGFKKVWFQIYFWFRIRVGLRVYLGMVQDLFRVGLGSI